MAKVVHPIRFDSVRRRRRNDKRRAARHRRVAEKGKLLRFFNRTFWFNIEPQIMWDATDFGEQGHNDNRPRRRPS